jgi:hypothetical protein
MLPLAGAMTTLPQISGADLDKRQLFAPKTSGRLLSVVVEAARGPHLATEMILSDV